MIAAGRLAITEGAIARALLSWYDEGRRDLPWRRQASAYRTLVSEFMLQQTVVAAAVPFFERFVARFTDLRALAAAPEDEVLAAWSGLGYYARARNLHRVARAVMARHDGRLPEDESALRELPGIGPYTAAAVAAIAFGRRTFALDGNAARVVARLTAVSAPIDKAATRALLRAAGLDWVPAQRPGDFAQAIMELGATLCVPRAPACDVCPLAAMCAARRLGRTAEIPAKTARAPKRVVRVASVRVRSAEHLLLIRRDTGLLAGTWTLPAAVIDNGRPAAVVARSAVRALGMVATRMTPVGQVRHLFTHRDVTVEVFEASARRGAATVVAKPRAEPRAKPPERSRGRPREGDGPEEQAEQRWVNVARLGELALSSFVRKQLALEGDKLVESP